jgi:hypothetical protein
MKYLRTRDDFLLEKKVVSLQNIKVESQYKSSLLVKETFENDITWGGSLIGRLINSTIRVAKIYYKTARIGSITPQVKDALDRLVTISRTTEDQRNKINDLTGRFLLEEIIKVVNSSDSVEKKVAQLLGNGTESNPGLVQSAINYIKNLDDFADKDIVVQKLEKFKKSLEEFKSQIGDLPDSDDDDADDSDADKGKKTHITILQSNYFNLLQSIRMMGEILKLKKVSIEPEVGKEYTYIDGSGKKVQVKVIDTEFQRQPGKDSLFLTKDDLVDKNKKIIPKILIAQKNSKGVYGVGSITTLVDPKVLSESLIIEELVGTGRGRGEGADSEIKSKESHSKAAFSKVRNSFMKNDIFNIIPKMEEMRKKRLSGDKQMGTYMVQIMKQVFANESTIGKPLSFQELIKEAVDVQQTEYAPIIKSISVLARVLLAFKEDMGLLQSMGELKKPITQFIQSYDNAKKVLPEIKEKSEKKNESFRIFEAEESEDRVKKNWRIEFSEEEEKKYDVDPEAAKKLQNEVKEDDKVTINVKDPSQYDQILKIVELFGKAYRMYAVDEIPSGRPNGIISQKTFREYEYIGKDEKTPSYDGKSGPGYGPWAARITFEKWQDGIMKILQDTKYRTVLANSEFVNEGPNQEKGSGLTLFTFMNDMLNEGGKYSNFRQRRHALLTKYFGGNAEEIEKVTGTGGANENPVVSSDDAGTPNELVFFSINQIKSPSFFEVKDFTDKNNFLNTFLLVKAKSGGEGMDMIIYIDDYIKDLNGHKLLVIKCHKLDPGTIKQNMISLYLKNKLSSKANEANEEQSSEKFKLGKNLTFVQNQPVYWGLVKFNTGRVFQERENTVLELSLINDFTSNKKIETYDLTFSNVKILAYYSEKDKKNHKLVVGKIDELPSADKSDITSLFKQNSAVQSKFGIKDRPKEK